jgi:glycosyltransferase involved in cell wall biosynthesis
MQSAPASPFVTVLLPVYNSKFLNYTLESLLLQTYKNFEILIINDGSTCPRTKEILSLYSSKYSGFIKVNNTPQNMGIAKALNFGLSQIDKKTIYIARQDSGDFSNPERLSKQVSFMEGHGEVSLCSTRADTIDMNGNILPLDPYMQALDFAGKSREELIIWFLTDNHIVHGSVMIRKKDFDKINGRYSETDLHAEDYELWLRMLYNKFRFFCIPEILYQWRADPGGICKSSGNLQTLNANLIRQRYRELFLKKDEK